VIRDGWFHTGDIGRVDEDGYMFIVGRQKDVIIRGGYNVYPREMRRLAPNSSTVRFAARLARHPVTTGRRLTSLTAELARIADASPGEVLSWDSTSPELHRV
jgi:acyl-CoA synthetase (AMP-forming)/AMP-acid ligase II